ncbi:hypothetical protein [Streptomyces sp. CB02460]|uniref:hypothetical protein n=1 Tax=Streptomyces sp. CB02460 TaxID=1703941 RepID=UPI00093C9560|nr:hypothetical protein [Streptomyces sp. CB02460]OKJ71649.1 hypothetical protein AMK30_22855 [Streptomyces sp. CB02460]
MSTEARRSPVPPRPTAPPPYEPAPSPADRPPPEPPARPRRAVAAAVCAVLGLGLIAGAAAGHWLTGGPDDDPAARSAYTVSREAWHSIPVDTLFPRTLKGDGTGPGGADRVWTRLAVAPDSGCADAFDPLLAKTLRTVGCAHVLRATYTDATASSVTTVGLAFTEADTDAMRALGARFADRHLDRRTDLLPRTYPVKDSPAASFGARQRASWSVHVLTGIPVVAFAVTGFADGRVSTPPQPADRAMATGATTPAAQAGLGHEAKGLSDGIERALRTHVADLMEQPR